MRDHLQALRRIASGIAVLSIMTAAAPVAAEEEDESTFKRIPTRYIAALGDPGASAGTGAESWGLWRRDPGPRGVWLHSFKTLIGAGGVAPSGWRFDPGDWWLDENGLIMEKPVFPVPPGKYVVTGNRETTAVLTIYPAGDNGTRRWELGGGATLHDVTHLRCRSARYTPAADAGGCSPANARWSAFPVEPGGTMPDVAGCSRRQYTVLFMIGEAVED